jgi:hypothetical protein
MRKRVKHTSNTFDLDGFQVIIDPYSVVIQVDEDLYAPGLVVLPASMAPLLRHMANCLEHLEKPYVKDGE